MVDQKTVSREEWLVARKEHLAKEKEFTQLRDELSQQRRELPRVKVDKEYVFEGPEGKETLAELFAGRSQLLVYHFMFGPDWEEGCPSCSFWADNYGGRPFLSHGLGAPPRRLRGMRAGVKSALGQGRQSFHVGVLLQ